MKQQLSFIKRALLSLFAFVAIVTGAKAQYVFVIGSPANGGEIRVAKSTDLGAYMDGSSFIDDVQPGDKVYFDFRPYDGYEFTGNISIDELITTDDLSVDENGIYSFTMPEYDGMVMVMIGIEFKKVTVVPPGSITINEENFPDANFRKWLISTNGNKTFLDPTTIGKISARECGIQDLTGIQLFTELTELDVLNFETTSEDKKNKISSIDLSANTKLRKLVVCENQISSLNLSTCPDLRHVDVTGNLLTDLDVADLEKLSFLYCSDNQLTSLDLSHNPNLGVLDCKENNLTQLNVANNSNLEQLFCENNQLTSIDVTNHNRLMLFNCNDNLLTSLDLTGCSELYQLYCFNNQIKGEAMTDLLNSLPQRFGYTVVIDRDSETEQNEITLEQVAIGNEKGWSVEAKEDEDFVPIREEGTHDYVDLGLPSGTLWATTNVGANKPQDVGLFFAWGDTEGHGNDPSDGYLFSWENYKWCEVVDYESFFTKYCSDSSRGKDGFTDGKFELDPEDDAAYVNWGDEWRMPTKEQLDELLNECTWTIMTIGDVTGYDVEGSNGNSIFLPITGWRIDDMLLDGGAYWSRSSNPDDVGGAYYLGWDDWGWYEYGGRTDGQCIRPVKNTADTFDPNATPLTFEAVESGTITVNYDETAEFEAIQCSKNGGEWTDVEWNQPISLAAGDVISFRGNNGTTFKSNEEVWSGIQFECSNTCYLYGNVMSLISSIGFETLKELTNDFSFAYLFVDSQWEGNNTITNHPTKDIVLPATTLTDYCYQGMFWGCRGLTRAPKLPATTLATSCYQDMFSSCTSLTTAPELPATELAPQCYMMMFNDCPSLAVAPELPATTLAYGCYDSMFSSCTSLTTAPELPATSLAEACYLFMFSGCTSLNYVKCLATDISADYCTISWLDDVAPEGTFVKDADMNDWEIGPRDGAVWGIPEGWTVNAILKCNSDGEGNYWATFYNDASFTADENATVYTAKVNSDKTKAILNKVADNTIPAGNAVLLKSTAKTAFLTAADGVSGTLEDNELQGSSTPITTPANTYMLVKGSNGVGFYHWTGETIPAGRAYLTLSSAAGAPSFLSFGTGSDELNAIEAVEGDNEDDGIIYDLAGRRLTTVPRQGIYVKNGKKYIVK